ncbi:MAG: hypothetical protein AAGK97_16370, partial [Bacteroidota bacterium]
MDIQHAIYNGASDPYLELNYYFIASSLKFNQIDSTHKQASLEVLLLIKQGDKVVQYDKYVLNSPLQKEIHDFYDTKRYAIQNGSYQVELEISNIADPNGRLKKQIPIEVRFLNDEVSLSNVQLLAKAEKSEQEDASSKNGLNLEPLPFAYYDASYDRLISYFEIYNASLIEDDYVIAYAIYQLLNSQRNLIKRKFKRRSGKPKDALVLYLDIKDLESGNYEFEINIQDKTKKKLAGNVVEFKRSNPYLELEKKFEAKGFDINNTFVAKLTPKELRYSLRAIAPRVHPEDIESLNVLIRNKEERYQRIFLHNFWMTQNQNDPETTYNEYMEVAKA